MTAPVRMAPPKAGSRKPPAGVQTYAFNYSRRARTMRFQLGEESWLVKDGDGENGEAGRWYCEGVLPGGGMRVRCELIVTEDGSFVVRQSNENLEEVMPAGVTRTEWRLCYNRGAERFRLRDEFQGILVSDQVQDYRGYMNVIYRQGHSHIFHKGPAYLDDEGVAHFA